MIHTAVRTAVAQQQRRGGTIGDRWGLGMRRHFSAACICHVVSAASPHHTTPRPYTTRLWRQRTRCNTLRWLLRADLIREQRACRTKSSLYRGKRFALLSLVCVCHDHVMCLRMCLIFHSEGMPAAALRECCHASPRNRCVRMLMYVPIQQIKPPNN